MVLAVLTIVLMALAVNATIQGLLTNNRLVNHTHDVRIGLQEQLTTLYEAEAEARAFVISGDERFAGQYQNTTQAAWAQYQRLTQLTIDNPVQQLRLPPLRLAIDRRLSTLSSMVAIRRSDPQAASVYVSSGIGIREMAEIREIIDAMRAEEDSLLQHRELLARHSRQQTLFMTAALVALQLGFLGLLFLNIKHDLGQRERAETAMRHYQLQIEDQNRQLEVRNREVERATHLKSEFLASMSHELRTPLNAIIGFSDLLGDQSPGPLNEKQMRFNDHVRNGARHLLALINDILDLSKIEAGQLELHPEPFNISQAAPMVISTVRTLAMKKRLTLDIEDPGDLAVLADPIRFKQILYNLL